MKGKKFKGKPSKLRREKRPLFDVSQETRNSIWGIFSFLLAVVATLSFFDRAGSAGQAVKSVSKSLFGWGFFLVPTALVILGIAFIKSISRKIATSAILGTLIFVLAFLGVFYSLGEGTFDVRVSQGGYLGVIFGYPLMELLGFTAAIIILPALMVISLLLALNVPLYQLVKRSGEEEQKEMMDKIVIRKGGLTVDEDRKPFVPSMAKPAVVAKAAKAEVSDKEFVIKNLKLGKWQLPPLELLHADQDEAITGDINANAQIIKRTLANFSIDVEMGEVSVGPTVTQFTMRPAVGVKLSRITALSSDLSLALAAHPLRIEAPIPGKALVGIEVPNKKVAMIGLRNMFEHEEYRKSKYFFPLALGRDVAGNPVYAGLEKMPHILIAGATGTGKSVSINDILMSLLYKHSPEVLKLILVDPKRVELSLYNDIPHLITPVIIDNKKVLGALKWAVAEMDRRYDMLSKSGARDIFSYNAKMTERKETIMPFIVIVIDELADLMASYGRDVEAAIVRLAQMARAVGIHLIVSTQRPSVEVITGLIKANITNRVALQVASQVDSRTILDMAGAEKLLGRGDMLFVSGDSAKPRRLQSPFISEKEVKDVITFIKKQAEGIELNEENDLSINFDAKGSLPGMGGNNGEAEDDMYEDARLVVVEAGKASASLLQRRLRVGYARAARLLDILEENGIIGPGEGAKPRDVYVKSDGSMSGPSLIGVTGENADTGMREEEV